MNGEIEMPYFASVIYRSFVMLIIKCAMPLKVKLAPGVMVCIKDLFSKLTNNCHDKPRPCYRPVPEWRATFNGSS